MAARVWGIDLGTTYSSIARVDDAGRPEIIRNPSGDPLTPSLVLFSGPASYTVGEEAKNARQDPTAHVAELVKLRMDKRKPREAGRPPAEDEWSFEAPGGKAWSAPEISALILRDLAVYAKRETDEPVTDVVITVPAWFGDAQRSATRQAGRIAGLNVVSLLNEPTAAAVAYGFGREAAVGQTVLVYDLGGGTFDATGMRLEKGVIRMVTTLGDHELGGYQWDKRLVSELARKFQEAHPSSGDPLNDEMAATDLRVKAEDLKHRLTGQDTVAPIIIAGTERERITVTRTEFEQATADLLQRTIDLTTKVLEELTADPAVAHVDRILLVGGSSFMPAVTQRLEGDCHIPCQLHSPNLAVVTGAALYGQIEAIRRMIKEDTEQGHSPEAAVRRTGAAHGLTVETVRRMAGMRITNVLSRGFGLVLHRSEADPDHTLAEHPESYTVEHLVHRNTPVPAVVPRIYHPVKSGQTSVRVVIAEQKGEDASERLEDNHFLKEGNFDIPGGAQKTDNLVTDFTITDEARIQVTMRHSAVEEPFALEVLAEAAVLSEQEEAEAARTVRGLQRVD